MEKLDLKDRKILYHLDLDSRQSFAQIGKKIRLHKDSVALRVKKLQEKGIIVRFNTLIDELKLGFTSLRFYFKFQYITPNIKKEIIQYFVNSKHTEIVLEAGGSHDLTVYLIARNPTDIYSFWQKTLTTYRDYFREQILSVYVGEKFYAKSFLIEEKDDRKKNMVQRGGGIAKYDTIDYQILKLLAMNARIPTIDIAKKLNTTTATIYKRINKLKESGIINRFHITIDWDKIGYRWFKIDLFLKEYDKIHLLTKYLEKSPHLAYIDKTVGYADLELEYIVINQQNLQEIIDNIQTKFPKLIQRYTYSFTIKSHKWSNIIFE